MNGLLKTWKFHVLLKHHFFCTLANVVEISSTTRIVCVLNKIPMWRGRVATTEAEEFMFHTVRVLLYIENRYRTLENRRDKFVSFVFLSFSSHYIKMTCILWRFEDGLTKLYYKLQLHQLLSFSIVKTVWIMLFSLIWKHTERFAR